MVAAAGLQLWVPSVTASLGGLDLIVASVPIAVVRTNLATTGVFAMRLPLPLILSAFVLVTIQVFTVRLHAQHGHLCSMSSTVHWKSVLQRQGTPIVTRCAIAQLVTGMEATVLFWWIILGSSVRPLNAGSTSTIVSAMNSATPLSVFMTTLTARIVSAPASESCLLLWRGNCRSYFPCTY